jgi:hypothetical protein
VRDDLSLPPTLVTQAQLARYLNVKRQAIHAHIKSGKLPTNAEGKIDLAVAKAVLKERLDPARSAIAAAIDAPPTAAPPAAPPPDTDNVTSYHAAKTLREIAEAKMAQLRLDELRGQLVRADRVELAAHKLGRLTRDALLGLPVKLAPKLAAESDLLAVERLLEEALRAVLTDIAKLTAIDVERAA